MSPVVAVCPVHGPFESRAFDLRNVSQVTLEGNLADCPMCGRDSAVMDGVFDFDERGVATVILAPEWSRAALNRVQQIARGAVSRIEYGFSKDDLKGFITDEFDRLERSNKELRAEVQQLAVQVNGLVDRQPMRKVKKFFVGLAVAVSFIVDVDGAVKITQRVVDSVAQIIETATVPEGIVLAPGPADGQDAPGGVKPF